MSHERDRLSWLNCKRHVLQHPVFIFISKPDILKLDLAVRAFRFEWFFRTENRYREIKSSEDSMRSNYCRLQHVVLVRDVADGLKQRLRILDECHERAQGQHGMTGRVLHHA